MISSQALVVAGMSGVGKTTLIKAALKSHPDWIFSVSATTRPIRPEEQDGREYHFLSQEGFAARMRAGEFLEYANVYGNMYGTLASEFERAAALNKHLMIEVDTVGCLSIKALKPDVPLLAILPPSFAELRRRLAGRGTEDEESLQRRLDNGYAELIRMRNFDYSIINDDLDKASLELSSLLTMLETGTHHVAPRVDALRHQQKGDED